jgi:hypothetical protein
VDLGWGVVALAVVGGAFDAVAVGAVSFNDAGVCSVSSWGVGSFGDFGDGLNQCRSHSVRGKNPPGWTPGGG